jgi:hypothetical protein
VPQAPQSVSVLSRVSQPSVGSLLQSSNPALHDPMPQVDALHVGVPLATKHTFPHPPQLSTSVAVSTSQPSVLLALQSASVPLHAESPHVPLTQFGVPPLVEQSPEQLPQCSTLLDVSVSHPFVGSPSQSANPVAHLIAHAPSAQEAVPLLLEQAFPQAEQFAALVSRFVSHPSLILPLQSPHPVSHLAISQDPSVQVGVA